MKCSASCLFACSAGSSLTNSASGSATGTTGSCATTGDAANPASTRTGSFMTPLLRQQPFDERCGLRVPFGDRNIARRRAVRARLLRVDRRAPLVQEFDDLVPALERRAVRRREARDARRLKADRELRRAPVERRAGREQQL